MLKRFSFAALVAAAVGICSLTVSTRNASATVLTSTTSVSYAASGSTATFSIPFPFANNSDLVVTDNGTTKTLSTHYTVFCAGCQSGGTVTFNVNPTAGHTIAITRRVPLTQPLNARSQGALRPGSYEAALDWEEYQIQQLQQQLYTVTSGDGGTGSLSIYDEGALQGSAASLNCVGDAITCAVSGGAGSVTSSAPIITKTYSWTSETFAPDAGNATAVTATGHGTGVGVKGTGGASGTGSTSDPTGSGVYGIGGANGGHGGLFSAPSASGGDGVEGYSAAQNGGYFETAGTAQYGVYGNATAGNSGGGYFSGNGTGAGIVAVAGSGGANGGTFTGTGLGYGVQGTAPLFGGFFTATSAGPGVEACGAAGVTDFMTGCHNSIDTHNNATLTIGPTNATGITLKPNTTVTGLLTANGGVTVSGASSISTSTSSLSFSSTAATARAGLRNASTRNVVRTTNGAPPDCAAATLNLTVTQFLDIGMATCATAQTINFPTWQGASGIVQGLPGTPAVGDIIGPIGLVATGANALTPGFGTGGTNGGGTATVAANTTRWFYCRLTSVTASSETATCY